MKNEKLTTRAGSYSVFATLIVLAIVVVANIMISILPQNYLKLDTTATKIYFLSDQTKQIAGSLSDEATLYWVAEKGHEDLSVAALLSRYDDLSPFIVVKRIVPSESPNFVKKYTSANLEENSVIVEMGHRNRVVDYSAIYAYDVSRFQETGEYETYFDGEAALTGALSFVTNANIPRLYFLTGHGEPSAISYIAEKLQRDNVEVLSYNLIGGAAAPDDADILFIYDPGSDYAKPEVEMLISFVEKGGKIIILTDFVNNDLPNLQYLAEYYALLATGPVIESSSENYAWGRPDYLLPNMKAHAITNALKNRGYNILMPGASGFIADQSARDSLDVIPLLVTSDNSGMVGVLVKELIGTVQGEIIWYTSGDMLVRDIDEMVSGANLDLFSNSVAFFAGSETNISIRSKAVMPERLQITASAGNIIAICLIVFVPAAYMIPGAIITVKRRRMK